MEDPEPVFPTLKTDRLLLTEITPGDSPAIFDLFSNQSVVEYYDLEVFTHASEADKLIEFFRSRFANSTGIRWAIRSKESEKLIGTCGFNSWNISMRNAVIGYDLSPSYWGNGIAQEAVREIVGAAFSGHLPCGALHRIQADTVPGNIASEKLLTRLGFEEEGVRRESGYWKDKYHDLKCFGLIKSEFVYA